jgi:transcriptional regulator with XRE-family HTH domain
VTALIPINYKRLVGQHVRRFRLRDRLTQEVLAERCGIYRTYLSRIESGLANPALMVMVALAQALHVEPSQLLLPWPTPPLHSAL